MRSFGLLTLAVAALAPFVTAAPAPVDVVAASGAGAAVVARSPALPIPVVSTAPLGVVKDLGVRGDQKCLQGILLDVKVDLSVHIDALSE